MKAILEIRVSSVFPDELNRAFVKDRRRRGLLVCCGLCSRKHRLFVGYTQVNRRTLGVLAVLTLFSLAEIRAARLKLPDAPSPLWSVKVFKEERFSSKTRALPRYAPGDRPGIAFLDDHRIAAYHVAWTGGLSSRENPDLNSARQLIASVFEADSGRLDLTKEWGARVHYYSINPTKSGILVRTGNVLRLLSKDFSEIRRILLADSDHCTISVSPTQRTVMQNCISTKGDTSHFDVREADTLDLKYSWSESPPLYHSYSISDTGIVAVDSNQRKLIFTEFGSHLWSTVFQSSTICADLPTFVVNTKVLDACGDLILVSTFGEVLMRKPYANGETLSGRIVVSSNGGRGAFLWKTMEISNHILSESSVHVVATRIEVYDFVSQKNLRTVDLSPLPKDYCDFDISPDGSKLAILNDGQVSVYSVPIKE